MTDEPVACISGPTGAIVRVYDRTKPYAFKNIFHVKLEIEAEFPGTGEKYTRTLEKMGVLEEDLEKSRTELLENFKKSALDYVLSPEFPSRLSSHREKGKKTASGYGGRT